MKQDLPFHKHTGIDSPKVDGKNLGPFAVLDYHPTAATWPAGEGMMVLSDSTTRRVSFMINGVVYYEELTAA